MKRLIYILYIGIILLLGAATFVEQARGNAYASRHIYHATWFAVLWGVLALLSFIYMVCQRLYKRLPVFLLHLSLLVILVGAGISFVTSKEGRMHMRMGATASEFVLTESSRPEALPFALRLDSFRVECYPGTQAPADFVSTVALLPSSLNAHPSSCPQATISMNHILSHRGYRFYQYSFDSDRRGTVLGVTYDPYGTPVTYFGYALLALSMVLILFAKTGNWK